MWRNWYMGSHSGPHFEGNQYAIGQSESTCHYALAPPSGFNVYFEIGVHLHLCRHYCDHNRRNPTSSYLIRARHHWYFAATKHTEYDPHAADYQNSYKYHCHVPILNHQLIAVITTTWWQLKVQKCGWYPRVRDKGCAWRLLRASFPRRRFVLYFVFS